MQIERGFGESDMETEAGLGDSDMPVMESLT